MSAPSIEQILEGLEPTNRKMIEDRLVAMSTAAFSANEKVGPLEEAVRQSNNDLNNNDLNNSSITRCINRTGYARSPVQDRSSAQPQRKQA